mmetsp:Transcript_1196/g.3918  ORF Transcript_1196/g.3918 Transcript_1196/m.3918 type:complete len:152 (+) Transcript_1196:2149-2604(+)
MGCRGRVLGGHDAGAGSPPVEVAAPGDGTLVARLGSEPAVASGAGARSVDASSAVVAGGESTAGCGVSGTSKTAATGALVNLGTTGFAAAPPTCAGGGGGNSPSPGERSSTTHAISATTMTPTATDRHLLASCGGPFGAARVKRAGMSDAQ